MKYANLKLNDVANSPGVAVSFYTQGCPHRCHNCFNPDTWDYNGGKDFTPEVLDTIISGLTANNIKRSLCILGGEPLCPENEFLTLLVIKTVKEKLPDTKVYVWTGYYFDSIPSTPHTKQILELVDCIIDGPFIETEKDLTLQMRGSRNQNIIYLDNNKKI